jgi:hypothetical protein
MTIDENDGSLWYISLQLLPKNIYIYQTLLADFECSALTYSIASLTLLLAFCHRGNLSILICVTTIFFKPVYRERYCLDPELMGSPQSLVKKKKGSGFSVRITCSYVDVYFDHKSLKQRWLGSTSRWKYFGIVKWSLHSLFRLWASYPSIHGAGLDLQRDMIVGRIALVL